MPSKSSSYKSSCYGCTTVFGTSVTPRFYFISSSGKALFAYFCLEALGFFFSATSSSLASVSVAVLVKLAYSLFHSP